MNKFVFKKVAELTANTELSEVDVKLAIVDDIAKMTGQVKQTIGNLKSILVEYQNAEKVIEQAMKASDAVAAKGYKEATAAAKVESSAGALLNKADAAAKGLGVDSAQITGYKDFENLSNEINGLYQSIINYKWKEY